ncbi:hypothetical protein BLA29_000254, partial [Euroglyphus maynei]
SNHNIYPLSRYFGKNRHTFVTNCTDTKFNDSRILSFIPIETEVLIFNGNNFTKLLPNYQMNMTTTKLPNHDKLLMVDLSRNGIQQIDSHAFSRMRHIETLILNDNRIDFSKNDAKIMFSKLNNLEELHLRNVTNGSSSLLSAIFNNENQLKRLKILNIESNRIDHIDDDKLFCSSSQIRQLLLRDNNVKQFHQNLSCLSELSLLDISNNQIETVDNQTIQSLLSSSSLSYHVNISENPFRCDCHLIDFYRFIRNQSKQNINDNNHYQQPTFDWIEEYRCHGTIQKYLDDLNEKDFICDNHKWMEESEISMVNIIGTEPPMNEQAKKDAIERYRFYVTLSYFVLSFLLLLLTLLIIILIYTNRDYLQLLWRFTCAGWNAKRDYTALDKNNDNPQQQQQQSINHQRVGWWRRIQQRSSSLTKVYVNDRSSSHRHYTNNDDGKNNRRYFIRHENNHADIAEEQL